jgi:hypothetical protein
MCKWTIVCAMTAALALGCTTSAGADDKALELKIVSRKDTYTLDTGGKTSKEYHKMLEDIAAALKNRQKAPQPPRPPMVDLTLQIKNTGKFDVVINVEGDNNVVTLEVKGPGVIDLRPLVGFTADFRLPKAIKLEAGKTHEIAIRALSDGFRGASRWIYWTEPGEYTIGATYQLATIQGGKGTLLKAEPIKVKVEEKK